MKKIIGTIMGIVLLAGLGYGGYYAWRTMNAVSSIPRENLLPQRTTTPTNDYPTNPETETPTTAEQQPLNILLLGTDTRDEATDRGRSDSIMLAHIPADRRTVYLISLPRDLYVDIPGHETNKINSAYAIGGAPLTVQTVESLFEITIDHVATINFEGFIGLVDAVGGVTVNNPIAGCDTSNKSGYCWDKGQVFLDSNEALRYARWRHGLPNGDIDRTKNQQRVLKAIVSKAIGGETLMNPNKVTSMIESFAKFLTLDDSLNNSKLFTIATSMRITSGEDIESFTVPIGSVENHPTKGSIVTQDWTAMANLRVALKDDNVAAFSNDIGQ